MEFKHYSVYGEINKIDNKISIMGLDVEFEVFETLKGFENGSPIYSYYSIVKTSCVDAILNIEWEMNKDFKFIKNLVKKLEKLIDENLINN